MPVAEVPRVLEVDRAVERQHPNQLEVMPDGHEKQQKMASTAQKCFRQAVTSLWSVDWDDEDECVEHLSWATCNSCWVSKLS